MFDKEEHDGSGTQKTKTNAYARRASLFNFYINLTTTQSISSRTPPPTTRCFDRSQRLQMNQRRTRRKERGRMKGEKARNGICRAKQLRLDGMGRVLAKRH